MADFYIDPNHPNAADDPANGTEVAPFVTGSYAITQASTNDTLNFAATTYDLGGSNLNISKGLTLQKWNNGVSGRPIFTNGDLSRILNIGTSGVVLLIGLEFLGDGDSSYSVEVRPVADSLTIQGCYFTGYNSLGAIGMISEAENTLVKSDCVFNITGGAALYAAGDTSITFEPGVSITMSSDDGGSQGAFYVSASFSGLTSTFSGDIILLDNIRPVYLPNGAGNVIIDELNLISVSSDYARNSIEIDDFESVIVRNCDLLVNAEGAGEDIWLYSSSGVAGTVEIYDNIIKSYTLDNHGIFIGSEATGVGHVANSFTSVKIYRNTVISASFYGIAGAESKHMIFVGNEKIFEIYDNITYGGAPGIGVKGEEDADDSSFIYNNFSYEANGDAIRLKGVGNVKICNNYILKVTKESYGIDCTENEGVNPSTGNTIMNNLIVVNDGDAIRFDTNSDPKLSVMDLNCYVVNGSGNVGVDGGTDYATLPLWKAATNQEYRSFIGYQALDSDMVAIEGSILDATGEIVSGVHEDSELALSGGAELVNFTPYRKRVVVT